MRFFVALPTQSIYFHVYRLTVFRSMSRQDDGSSTDLSLGHTLPTSRRDDFYVATNYITHQAHLNSSSLPGLIWIVRSVEHLMSSSLFFLLFFYLGSDLLHTRTYSTLLMAKCRIMTVNCYLYDFVVLESTFQVIMT